MVAWSKIVNALGTCDTELKRQQLENVATGETV